MCLIDYRNAMGIQVTMGNKLEPENIDLEWFARKYDFLGVSDIVDACK
jgi:hypothetical protein